MNYYTQLKSCHRLKGLKPNLSECRISGISGLKGFPVTVCRKNMMT